MCVTTPGSVVSREAVWYCDPSQIGTGRGAHVGEARSKGRFNVKRDCSSNPSDACLDNSASQLKPDHDVISKISCGLS
jgi:hypothetical protein